MKTIKQLTDELSGRDRIIASQREKLNRVREFSQKLLGGDSEEYAIGKDLEKIFNQQEK